MEEIEEIKKVMVVKCTICNEVFHVCIEPNCYIDKAWQKELRSYSKDDWLKIEVVPLGSYEFGGYKKCCKTGKADIAITVE